MLEVKNLSKIYPKSDKGIKKIDLMIEPGEICAFIGPNGAGKSTTIKSIVGIHPFDTGQVLLDGIDISKEPQQFKMKIGYSPDNPDIYENLRGIEYLNFIGSIYRVPKELFVSRVETLLDVLDMGNSISNLISTYSHGMKQRLVLISIFLHNPDLIVLDEPFVGLDPNATDFLIKELKRRADSGKMIIYSTHVLEVAEKLCNRVVLINQGNVRINCLMDKITDNESLGDVFKRETNYAKY